MTRGRRSLWLALLPALVACHSVKLAPETRSSVRVVSVAPEVVVPEELDQFESGLAGFGLALAASGLFQLGAPAESQATFHLEVYQADLAIGNLDYEYKPILGIQASLRDAAGKVLWQSRGSSSTSDDLPAHPFTTYSEQPEETRAAFTAAARLASADLIENLREQMKR